MLELRASKIGGCPRSYVLDLRQGEKELLPRQKLYFAVGKALEPVIMEHAGYNPAMLFHDLVEVRLDIGGEVILTGHPDSEDPDWVIECKTMRSFAFKKLLRDGIEVQFPQYLVQGSVYCRGRDKRGVRYLCLDKDASHIEEFLVTRATLEPYWDKAVKNARLIARWLNKSKLPGRPEDLPKWYCVKGYCMHEDCRYHLVNRQKTGWSQRAKTA